MVVGGWFLFYSYNLQLKLGDKCTYKLVKECNNTLVEKAITLRRAIQKRSRESMINTDTKKRWKEVKSDNFCYSKVGRAITLWGAIEYFGRAPNNICIFGKPIIFSLTVSNHYTISVISETRWNVGRFHQKLEQYIVQEPDLSF